MKFEVATYAQDDGNIVEAAWVTVENQKAAEKYFNFSAPRTDMWLTKHKNTGYIVFFNKFFFQSHFKPVEPGVIFTQTDKETKRTFPFREWVGPEGNIWAIQLTEENIQTAATHFDVHFAAPNSLANISGLPELVWTDPKGKHHAPRVGNYIWATPDGLQHALALDFENVYKPGLRQLMQMMSESPKPEKEEPLKIFKARAKIRTGDVKGVVVTKDNLFQICRDFLAESSLPEIVEDRFHPHVRWFWDGTNRHTAGVGAIILRNENGERWPISQETFDDAFEILKDPDEPSPSGEVRTTSSTGAQKGMKPERYDLIPVEALAMVARLYGKGAEKYAAHNWRKGYEWSKSYAAMQRHATQFWSGEDVDEEMQLPHLASVVFHAFTMMVFMTEHPEFDDRYVRTNESVEDILRSGIASGAIDPVEVRKALDALQKEEPDERAE